MKDKADECSDSCVYFTVHQVNDNVEQAVQTVTYTFMPVHLFNCCA